MQTEECPVCGKKETHTCAPIKTLDVFTKEQINKALAKSLEKNKDVLIRLSKA